MANKIDQELCKSCAFCIAVCPCNVIAMNKENKAYSIPERESACIHCGQCMAICSANAIKIEGITYEKDLFPLPQNTVDYQKYFDFLATRRSVRNFKKEPISKETIQKILNTLALAPYGASPNDVHITVVTNREIIESSLPMISEFLVKIVRWMKNPFMRFMIKRKKGLETLNTLQNHLAPIAATGNYNLEYGDRITRDAPALLIFHAHKGAEEHTNNALIYGSYAMLAAHSLGLGSTMNGLVPAAINKLDAVREIFGIPTEHEAVISLMLGYPKYHYKKGIQREKSNIHWIE